MNLIWIEMKTVLLVKRMLLKISIVSKDLQKSCIIVYHYSTMDIGTLILIGDKKNSLLSVLLGFLARRQTMGIFGDG